MYWSLQRSHALGLCHVIQASNCGSGTLREQCTPATHSGHKQATLGFQGYFSKAVSGERCTDVQRCRDKTRLLTSVTPRANHHPRKISWTPRPPTPPPLRLAPRPTKNPQSSRGYTTFSRSSPNHGRAAPLETNITITGRCRTRSRRPPPRRTRRSRKTLRPF